MIGAANNGYGKTHYEVLTIIEMHVEQKEDVSPWAVRVTYGWWQKFLKRNLSWSLRSGDCTAGISMDTINEQNMANYFDQVFDKGDFGITQKPFTTWTKLVYP